MRCCRTWVRRYRLEGESGLRDRSSAPRRVANGTPSERVELIVALRERAYLTSVSILNIGRYIAMMITPTISPTPIIISGSMIEVSDEIDESTSSS